MTSKHRSSISSKNLGSKLRCTLSVVYISDFKNLMEDIKYHINKSMLISGWNNILIN